MKQFSPFGWHGIAANESPRRQAEAVRGMDRVQGCGKHTMRKGAAHRGLQSVAVRCSLNFPKIDGASRCHDVRSNRHPILPKSGKSVACYSAFNLPACGASIGRGLVHIGGVLRPSVREALAAFVKPGSVVTPPFLLIPKIHEVSHV